ncbi:carbohydrate porin [Sphingomonas sp. CROZ-RG-20F-R02-07]|uniref:carbohydrate porin n=1 Tax=Sphingomonas sp. CROZ-RG-20F-R02-07 TaxID=2914832 RepID=UPI001F57F4CE|nr:carbohydrate porin [Sphingomonas sp. CROZ-RG-20F-R02-07]
MILAYRTIRPPPSPIRKARVSSRPLLACGALLASLAVTAPSAAAQADPTPPLVTASAQLTLDEVADVSGGIARGNRLLDKLEGVAEFDGTRLGAPWLAARADVGLTNGRKISGDLVSDIQGIDNIEGVRGFRIYNAWISASGSLGGVEAGVIDLNSQFDVHNVAALFVNSSFGVGPSLSHSGLNGPSIYPNSGLGAVGWLDDTDRSIRVRLGVFDGVPNDPDDPARTTFRLDDRPPSNSDVARHSKLRGW